VPPFRAFMKIKHSLRILKMIPRIQGNGKVRKDDEKEVLSCTSPPVTSAEFFGLSSFVLQVLMKQHNFFFTH
jgi:hypothetical protein